MPFKKEYKDFQNLLKTEEARWLLDNLRLESFDGRRKNVNLTDTKHHLAFTSDELLHAQSAPPLELTPQQVRHMPAVLDVDLLQGADPGQNSFVTVTTHRDTKTNKECFE